MSEYSDCQSSRNAQYRKAYAEWVSSLSPKQRRQLEAQGLLEPQVDPFHIGKQHDVTELRLAAEDQGGAPEDPQPEQDSEATWAALRRLIAELLADPNPALGIDCLALVSGIGFLGESMTQIARRHKVTRAAVSKRCVQWTRRLRLLPSRAMRSLTARQAYQLAQKHHHQTHERFNSRKLSRPSD